MTGPELAAFAPDRLRPGQSVVLDWHDGPREGFIRFDQPPSCWYFRIYAEASQADGLDERLFLLCPAADDAVSRLLHALEPLGPPSSAQWAPIWRFPSDELRRAAEAAIEALVRDAGPPEVVVLSTDLGTVAGVWLLVP